jgi:hypothetical protein
VNLLRPLRVGSGVQRGQTGSQGRIYFETTTCCVSIPENSNIKARENDCKLRLEEDYAAYENARRPKIIQLVFKRVPVEKIDQERTLPLPVFVLHHYYVN